MSDETYHIQPDDVETQVFPWGNIKWLNEPQVTSTERLTVGMVVLNPGQGHERHNHPKAEEVLYFISGEGEQMVAEERFPVKAGDAVFIPEGVYHETINTGWEPLRVLAIYAPPGPEALLRELEECQVLPPGELPGPGA